MRITTILRAGICLDLEYSSHRQNYRGIGPMIRRMLKYEEAKKTRGWSIPFTKGRPTKRVQREEKLRMQVEYSTPYVLSTVRKWSA